MNEWVAANKRVVIYLIVIALLGLTAFYVYMIRPLQENEVLHQEEIDRLEEDISFYETQIAGLQVQSLTPEEIKTLLDSVPMRPNVEQSIADLEETELDTGVIINNISFNIQPNPAIEAKAGAEGTQGQKWSHLLPEEVLAILETQVKDVDALTVSYVEMNMSVEGDEEDVHLFVEEIEKLPRITHVQSYNYDFDEETENLRATITIRTFYCEDFSLFIQEENAFQLNYKFDADHIKRYQKSLVKETSPVNTPPSTVGEGGKTGENYQPPAPPPVTYDGPVFYIVQTGAYDALNFYGEQMLQKLVAAGVYPQKVYEHPYDRLFTGVAKTREDAQLMANYLSANIQHSIVREIPYLAVNETDGLQSEIENVMEVVSSLTIQGITEPGFILSEDDILRVNGVIDAYTVAANEAVGNVNDLNRKNTLLDSIKVIERAEQTLQYYQLTGDVSGLWAAHGTLVEFALVLNGFERVESK